MIVMLSGGFDSVTLLHYALERYDRKDILAITIDYNQKNRKELKAAMLYCHRLGVKHRVLDFKCYSKLVPTTAGTVRGCEAELYRIPFKNLLFMGLVFCVAKEEGHNVIELGVLKDDQAYEDCTLEYWDKLESMSEGIKINLPFRHMSKEDLSFVSRKLKVDHTFSTSCYYENEEGCECPSCRMRETMINDTQPFYLQKVQPEL